MMIYFRLNKFIFHPNVVGKSSPGRSPFLTLVKKGSQGGQAGTSKEHFNKAKVDA